MAKRQVISKKIKAVASLELTWLHRCVVRLLIEGAVLLQTLLESNKKQQCFSPFF